MRILFLVYHGFAEASGITKKIHYQVKGLRQNGHDVRLCHYDVAPDGHRCRYVDGRVLRDFGTGPLAALRQRIDYSDVLDYCRREAIGMVYARCYQNATPWLAAFFSSLHRSGIRSVTEIPTYPYDGEFDGSYFSQRLQLRVDQLFRRQLYRQMDAVVTFSDATEIFGQRTIRISNGVDFDSIPLHAPFTPLPPVLHLLGVAEVHYWHGFDRLLAGMGEYYRHGGKQEIVFHIVGGVHPSYMTGIPQQPGFRSLLDGYGIAGRVVFHGPLFGARLDEVFGQCQFAVGSLARHRSGITVIKTLKNREYATRGLPFIYSEQDSDFDHQPYVLKAPADESPIDMQRIIDFMRHFTMQPADIRRSVAHLSWKIQMQQVVDQVFQPL